MISPNALKSFVEPLEARIAPARIIKAGVPNSLLTPDIDYTDATSADEDAIFIDTETAPASDLIAQALGPGNPGLADTFYLRLGPGDILRVFTDTNGLTDPKITVKKGNAVVFLVDLDGDNEVDTNEITGIALGANSSIELKEGLTGDIVANLDEKGTKDIADDTLGFSAPGGLSSLVSVKQGIAGIVTGSSILGNIIAAGNINNVRVFGGVKNIFAGAAANGATFDFYPDIPGGDGTVDWTIGDGVTDDVKQGIAGSSITKVAVDNVIGRIEAGGGGAGAKGGSLNNIILSEDPTGFILKAGDGGVSNSVKVNGGAGGGVTSVFIAGADDATANELVRIAAGLGGNSTAGIGGVGGALNSIFVGFSVIGTKPIPSALILRDNIEILAGSGGNGKTGGKGGAMTRVDVNVSTPDDANLATIELTAIAGNGGMGGLGGNGKGGAGGTATDVTLRDVEGIGVTLPDVMIQAGSGGTTTAGGAGGAGGSILRAILRGFDLAAHAGNGASGKIGGVGGSITTLTVEEGAGVLARSGDFTSGNGGDGLAGNGGKAGNISSLRVVNSDLEAFNAISGNGGAATGTTGKGGAGGNITGLDGLDNDVDLAVSGTFVLHSGNGGAGVKGGGSGGSILSTEFESINMAADVASGNGGAVLGLGALGKGGNGGALTKLNITARGFVGVVEASGVVISGNGGNGGGTKGAGGAGGNITTVNLNAAGSSALTSGTGGDGSGAAPGKGGDIKNTLVFGQAGTGSLIAGSGGVNGNAPAKGGSILGVNNDLLSGLFSSLSLIIKAGDGTHGGAGGSLKFIGYGSTNRALTPTPIGQIDILAGNGSAEGKFAGAGGNLDNVSGAVASEDAINVGPFNTNIFAGDVISIGTPAKSAAGGNITNLDLRRGGNQDGVLLIEAGDANDTTVGATGAKGGLVKGVSIAEVDAVNVFRGIAGGDGGDALKKGGLGGSITDVKVLNHDVGVRSGQSYGYAGMGGLFAGAGGTALGGTAGQNGSVTNVSAQMIATIVAGRGATPKMAEKVASIYVGTPTDLLRESEFDIDLTEADADPDYAAYVPGSYDTNTFVAATMDPDRVNGNKFSWNDNGDGIYQFDTEVPIDGIVASKVFDQKTCNFTPEARFTAGQLYDFDNKY
jgi:hypothetical protein